ncbi:MAG: hypothetical protein Q8K58_07370 [Acidimicrobiales bacterium]|nr:hypothetical protein [Acidimicrobiales bacterium]
MLAVSSYPKDYVDECRAQLAEQLRLYDGLLAAARDGGRKAPLNAAIEGFERVFFTTLVVVLDGYFAQRSRGLEGKDGNPLNEVRVLCTSLLQNDGRLLVDKGIKLKPETSVLHLEEGAEIRLDGEAFLRLSDAYFAEILHRYT